MIKRILFILLFGLIIAGVGILIMREAGFAVFSYADTTVEIPLIKFYFGVKESLSKREDYDLVVEKLDAKIKLIIDQMDLK